MMFQMIWDKFPISYHEALEGYNAFLLLYTHLDLYGKINSLFTLSVLLRIPFILLFGLNNLSVRLPSILLWFGNIYLISKWSGLIVKESRLRILIKIAFIISPFLLTIHLFNLQTSLVLTFFLAAQIFWIERKKKFLSIFILLLLLILLPLFKYSPLSHLKPSFYLWQIDRRLSYDQTFGSPLNVSHFNVNRLIHNKLFYEVDQFFRILISPFDWEKISSPTQSLAKVALPDIGFFQLPVIFLGLIILIREKSRYIFKIGLIGLILTIIFYENLGLVFLIPLLLLAEASGISFLLRWPRGGYKLSLSLLLGVVYLLGVIIFFDLMFNHQDWWVNKDDLRQQQIWSTVKDKVKDYKEVKVTDRLGDPAPYYLYYSKFSPQEYQNLLKSNQVTFYSKKTIDQLGKMKFYSFNYFESSRDPHQLWIGLCGEFTGKFNGCLDEKRVINGKIISKIKDIKTNDTFFGEEIWIVETYFTPEENRQ